MGVVLIAPQSGACVNASRFLVPYTYDNYKCKNKDSSDAAESLDPELDPEESDREEEDCNESAVTKK